MLAMSETDGSFSFQLANASLFKQAARKQMQGGKDDREHLQLSSSCTGGPQHPGLSGPPEVVWCLFLPQAELCPVQIGQVNRACLSSIAFLEKGHHSFFELISMSQI